MKTETKRKLIAIMFPERCPYCSRVVLPCETACDECKEKLPASIYKNTVAGTYKLLSAVPYRDEYAEAIKKLKFKKKKQYAYQLAKLMAERFKDEINESYDVLTFVPLHNETLKERGFNQCQLLAEELSRFLNIPCAELLKKPKKNLPQHTLDGSKREKNVKGVFRCTDKSAVKNKRIILLDDITTTRYTMAECSKILRDNEAEDILCMTFAITLPKTT